MRSWHDYRLAGYRVDGERKELSLSLRRPDKVAGVDAELTFSGLLDYRFEHDLGINIVAAITESPIAPFVQENQALFAQEEKWGWPRAWKGTAEKTVQQLASEKRRLWVLTSSYGLTGWVIASSVAERV